MNFLDVTILVLLGLGILAGLLIGVARVLCALGGLVAAFFLALHFNSPASSFLSGLIASEALRRSVAFTMIFLVVLLAGSLAAWGARKLLKVARLGWFDRLAGVLVGGVGAVLLSSLFVMVLAAFVPKGSAILKESQIAPLSLRATEVIVSLVPHELRQRIADQRKALTERLDKEAPDLLEGTGSEAPTPSDKDR